MQQVTGRKPKIPTRVGHHERIKTLMATPTPIEIIKPLGGLITCFSNSNHWQKVILTWGTTTIVFEGAGCGMPLKLADGATVYPMMPSLQNYTIHTQFLYSEQGPEGPFFNSIVEEPIFIPNHHHTQILISADVALEHINNDAMLMINYERMDRANRVPMPAPARTMSQR